MGARFFFGGPDVQIGRLSPCGSSATRPWEVLDFRKLGAFFGHGGHVFLLFRGGPLEEGNMDMG